MSFNKEYYFYNQRGQRSESDWQNAFGLGMSLKDLGDTLTADIPFDVRVSVELMGGQQSKTCIYARHNSCADVLEVNDIYIMQARESGQSFIGIDEIRVDPDNRFPDLRGKGLGKIFLNNCVELCEKLNIPKIRLTAGRENGALFWARHGFNIEQMSQRHNFWKTKNNYEDIRDQLSPETCQLIESAFQQAEEDASQSRSSPANRILADIDEDVDGTPVRELLYRGVEYRAVLDLRDAEQKAAFENAMTRLPEIREQSASLATRFLLSEQSRSHKIKDLR